MARFDRTIPPGGEGKITLEVRTKGYQGNFHKSARVLTNDPNNPQVIIAVKGKVWVPIRSNQRYANLKGILGEKIESVVHLRGEKQEPLIVKLDSVSIPEKVAVELKEIEKGRSYQLKVKNKVVKETTYGGQIRLTTSYPEKPEMVIRILGHIRAPLEVRPKALNFGRMPAERLRQLEKAGRSMSRPVMVLLNKGNDLKIVRVDSERSLFKVVTREIRRGRVVQLRVEPILEKLKKGVKTDRLKIHTNQKGRKVLEVPVRIEIL
ncbi:MAG: hypothetical protein HWN68_04550 [Desulfobacterales bacterium]|nr:hypothetical protein [Desulfobacterales bacterium]